MRRTNKSLVTIPDIEFPWGEDAAQSLAEHFPGFNPGTSVMRLHEASAPLPRGVTLSDDGILHSLGESSSIIVEIVPRDPIPPEPGPNPPSKDDLARHLHPQDGGLGANAWSASAYGGRSATSTLSGAQALPYQWAWGWKNPRVWDWLDSQGIAQGLNPFAEVGCSVNDAINASYLFQSPALNLLVEQWRTGARANYGIIVRLNPPTSTVICRSRQHAEAQFRPRLLLTHADGTEATLQCGADAHLVTSSSSTGASQSLEIGTAALWFDLSEITLPISSASIELFCVKAYRTATLQLYACDLAHLDQSGSVELGIASAYPKDDGLAAHPQVYVCERFEDANGQARGWQASWDAPYAVSNPAKIIVGATDPQFPDYSPRLTGQNALKVVLRNVGNGGTVNMWPFWFNRSRAPAGITNPSGEPERCYVRFSFRLSEDWNPSLEPGGGKFLFGFDSRYVRDGQAYLKPDAPAYGGNGGTPSLGANGFSIRGGYDVAYATGISSLCDAGYRPIRFYSYFPDAHFLNGSGYGIASPYFGSRSFFRKGVWYDIEMFMQLNSIDSTGNTIAYFGDTIQYLWSLQSTTAFYQAPTDPLVGTDTRIQAAAHVYYGDKTGYFYPALDYSGTKLSASDGSRKVTDTAILQSAGVGRHDGKLKVWVNGRLTMDISNLLVRHIPSIQIQRIWCDQYAGGVAHEVNDITVHIANFVLADAYIGPVRDA